MISLPVQSLNINKPNIPAITFGNWHKKDELQNEGDPLAESLKTENGMGQTYTNPDHPVIKRSVKLAQEVDAKDILEIGSGHGVTALEIAKNTAVQNLLATDINEEGLKKLAEVAAKKKFPIDTQVLDITQKLPDELKEKHDLVVAKDVLPFLDPKGVTTMLKNVTRSLKEGGWFIITAPSMRSELATKNEPVHPHNPFYRKLSDGDKDFLQTTQDALSFESISNLSEKLGNLGLELVEVSHFGRANGWLMAIGQKIKSKSELT